MFKQSYKKPTFVLTSLTLALGLVMPQLAVAEEFDEASVYFELNNTDGDLGIHSLVDGEAWKKLVYRDTRGKKMLDIRVKGRMKKQGLTEIFFESAEPPFESDDPEEVTLSPEEFFERFPEGDYHIRGVTLEGEVMESVVEVTHLIPAPPDIYINGDPIPGECDEEELPAFEELSEISWDPVTMSHDDLGRTGEEVEVDKYQVVLEREEPTPLNFTLDLSPDVTAVEIPEGLVNPGDEIKIEVLVREESGNQTATESCFVIED